MRYGAWYLPRKLWMPTLEQPATERNRDPHTARKPSSDPHDQSNTVQESDSDTDDEGHMRQRIYAQQRVARELRHRARTQLAREKVEAYERRMTEQREKVAGLRNQSNMSHNRKVNVVVTAGVAAQQDQAVLSSPLKSTEFKTSAHVHGHLPHQKHKKAGVHVRAEEERDERKREKGSVEEKLALLKVQIPYLPISKEYREFLHSSHYRIPHFLQHVVVEDSEDNSSKQNQSTEKLELRRMVQRK